MNENKEASHWICDGYIHIRNETGEYVLRLDEMTADQAVLNALAECESAMASIRRRIKAYEQFIRNQTKSSPSALTW